MRVLLIAEAANPEWTSVPLVGWSHSQAIASTVDAHLVTQVRNRAAIERAGLQEGKDFTAIDSEAVASPLCKAGKVLPGNWTTRMAVNSLAYYYFERLVWKRFGPAIRAGEYDVVHRLTPLSPTIQSTLAKRCHRTGTPFMLGPLNGGTPWPKGFGTVRRKEGEWLSYVRDVYKLLPAYRATRACATAIIVGSHATENQVPVAFRDRCVYIPENAIAPARFSAVSAVREASAPIRVCFVGRLVPYKGADMLIEAAAPLLREKRVVLDFIGDGPEMAALRAKVAELGVEEQVEFAGWVDHAELQNRMARSQVFGFPSIREFGGAVVLEAMALGLVPIVVDYGGPGELVRPETGFCLPPGSRSDIVESLQHTLTKVATMPPEVLHAMGQKGRDWVCAHMTWEAKARQVSEVYDWVAGKRETKPVFPFELP